MSDQMDLPRVALVFGDEAGAAHLREAMRGYVDIVYAASAAEFDPDRMADAKAAAVLVNLDGGDWLENVEASLGAAGIVAIYNDAEISRGLEGWARARWLRHLLAKLRGSTDVDPPRPVPAEPLSTASEPDPEVPAASDAVVERPLSPHEIETMTADFVAIQDPTLVQVGEVAPPPSVVIIDPPLVTDAGMSAEEHDDVGETPAAPAEEVSAAVPIEAVATPVLAEEAASAADSGDETGSDGDGALDIDVETLSALPEAAAPIADSGDETGSDGDGALDIDAETLSALPEAAAPIADSGDETGSGSDSALDVDTETLSAMIDARLADAEFQAPSDSFEVWRVAEGGAVSKGHLDLAGETASTVAAEAGEPSEQPPVDDEARDDVDVLAGLPSLDSWQLVDAEAAAPVPAASGEGEGSEPVLPDDHFAGLELVPMETISSVKVHTEPIERWLHESEPEKAKAAADSAAKKGLHGGKA